MPSRDKIETTALPPAWSRSYESYDHNREERYDRYRDDGIPPHRTSAKPTSLFGNPNNVPETRRVFDTVYEKDPTVRFGGAPQWPSDPLEAGLFDRNLPMPEVHLGQGEEADDNGPVFYSFVPSSAGDGDSKYATGFSDTESTAAVEKDQDLPTDPHERGAAAYHVLESRYSSHGFEEGRQTAKLTAVFGDRAQPQALFRWM